MFKAAVFDLDDTLYDYGGLNKRAVAQLCEFTCGKLEISESLFYDAYRWGRDETKRCLGKTGASHNRLLYCQRALEYLNRTPAGLALDMYEVYWGYMLEHMCLRDGAMELLKYCKECGLKIGICTDLTAHIQHRKIRKLGLELAVDVIVTSEEAGVEKPGEAIYKMLLEKLSVPPKEVIFIGDSLEKDVVGPEKMGMCGVWFHGMEDGVHRVVSSLREVREILDEGN